jgi:hypothetical protein
MQALFEVREQYGNVWVTAFPDGLIVPWQLLPLGKYISYLQDHNRKAIPHVQLEDEIFRSCVLDKSIIRRMGFLKAGVVSTVVHNVWEYSGPTSISSFKADLDTARAMLHADFPYKPEEVYEMPYDVLMMRVAQAEHKLIELGLQSGPLEIFDRKEEGATKGPKGSKRPQDPEQIAKAAIDAKKLWEQRQGEPEPVVQSVPGDRWWKVSPVLEANEHERKNVKPTPGLDEELALDNDERASPPEVRKFLLDSKIGPARDKMVQDARWIYKDLLEGLERKKGQV